MCRSRTTGVLDALLEALRVLQQGWKLIFSFMLFLIIPCKLLSKLADRSLPPLLVIDMNPLKTNSELASYTSTTDIKINIGSLILSGLSRVVTVYLSAVACSSKEITAIELLRGARRTWWRAVITLFFFEFLLRSPTLVLGMIGRVPGLIERVVYVLDGSLLPVVVVLSLGLAAWLAVLGMLENLGLVVSVVEGSSGMGALGRAWELVRERKAKVVLLMVAMVSLQLLASKVSSFQSSGWSQMVLAIPLELLRVYEWLVLTVFYYSSHRMKT